MEAVAAHLSGVHPLKLQVTRPSLKLDFLLAKHTQHLVHLESSHEVTGELSLCELTISKYLLSSLVMANLRPWSPRLCPNFTNKGTISGTPLEHIRKSLLWDDSKLWNCRLHVFCLVHIVESGTVCTNPQAGRDGHRASMFDQLISIRNPVFRSQNLNDNAADAKSRSPARSANRIYAFWEAVGGGNCSTEKLNYAQGFCVAELRPPPPLYTNRCGRAQPAISPIQDHSPTVQNVLIKYSSQIIRFGLKFLFPSLFRFGKGKNGG